LTLQQEPLVSTPPPPRLRAGADITRRRLLHGAFAAAGLAVAGGAYGIDRVLGRSGAAGRLPTVSVPTTGRADAFVSRPDLRPPRLIARGFSGESDLFVLGPGSEAELTQQGPMLAGADGAPVWFAPLGRERWVTNVTACRYRGEPALAWWEGVIVYPGFGQGDVVIVDSSYREVTRVSAGNGRLVDLHELRITDRDTALITCYPLTVTGDLSALGGPRAGVIADSVIQEVDLRTDRLLLEWRSLDHVPVSESYKRLGKPYDYFHANSIAVMPDGHLLVSARHTWTLYKIDRRTGQVLWRLGGKRSDFRMGPGAQFAWQHDARMLSPSAFTVFDNGSNGSQTTHPQSRGLMLHVDEARREVTVARSYVHPTPLLATAMGSVQVRPDGHVVVGWGTASHVSEFTPEGTLVADASLPRSLYSYRALRQPWTGVPRQAPALAARADEADSTLFVSWNGDTRTRRWQVSAGPRPGVLSPIGTAERRGFETAIRVPGRHRYARVTALGERGARLGRSAVVALPRPGSS
jgi:hypothetical protein